MPLAPSRPLAQAAARRYTWAMAKGRGSWKPAWAVGGGLLLVPLVAVLWLRAPEATPATTGRDGAGQSGVEADRAAARRDERSGRARHRVLVGTVTGPRGEPVVAAELFIERHDVRTESDAAGRYRLGGVPFGPAVLAVSAEGFETARLSVGEAAGALEQTVNVQLERLGAVRGEVHDPEGRPVAKAFVGCVDSSDEPPLDGTFTQDDGSFSLPASAVGCSAVASHGSFGDSEPVLLETGPDNVLHLGEGASIEGVVVDAEGRPLGRYAIAIESYRANRGEQPSRAALGRQRRGRALQVDDAAGSFLLDRLRAGRYVLTASAPGRPPVQSESIELERGEQARGVRIVLATGGVLRGRVSDASNGEPIERARVALDGLTMTRAHRVAPALADAEGQYLLEGVPAEPFSVRVSASGYRSRVVPGLRGTAGAEIELDVDLEPLSDPDARETEYTGIGAVLATTPAGIAVAALVEGGAAEAAGVRRLDRILRIDGQSTDGWTLPRCVQHLRGPPGSRVAVTLEREREGEVEVVITRERFVR